MRITIFGATGLLGKSLMREHTDDEVSGLGSKDADVRDPQQVLDAIERTRPDWIVLTAAYTDVDGCEINPNLAFDVNSHGAVNVAQAAKMAGARLLFLSTDYVFDGAKNAPYEINDPRAPRTVYGRSKAEAEDQIARILPDCCIVRTAWLFGVGGRCFPDTILKLAATRLAIDVVDDQRGSPTYAPDLAHAIFQICHKNAAGVIHATNTGDCTCFGFARLIIAGAGLAADVRPTTSDKFPRPAERPKYSVLSQRSLSKYGISLPAWQDALARYLQEKQSGL
jgi:dTDP-4-dehydrorhamnose reductase